MIVLLSTLGTFVALCAFVLLRAMFRAVVVPTGLLAVLLPLCLTGGCEGAGVYDPARQHVTLETIQVGGTFGSGWLRAFGEIRVLTDGLASQHDVFGLYELRRHLEGESRIAQAVVADVARAYEEEIHRLKPVKVPNDELEFYLFDFRKTGADSSPGIFALGFTRS